MKGTLPSRARPLATPAMVASATPTFRKRPGFRRAKSSKSLNPRSAVRKTTRSSRAARSVSARMNAFRMSLRLTEPGDPGDPGASRSARGVVHDELDGAGEEALEGLGVRAGPPQAQGLLDDLGVRPPLRR